jgi:hypothetical protein
LAAIIIIVFHKFDITVFSSFKKDITTKIKCKWQT